MDMNKRRRALARHRIDHRKLRAVETESDFNSFIDAACETLQGWKIEKPKKKPKQMTLGEDREETGGHVRGDGES